MSLRVRYLVLPGGSGRLSAEASNGEFAGHSDAPFSAQELQSFAEQLLAYPADPVERVTLSRGEDADETFGLTLYPTGASGVIGAQVRMASERAHPVRAESRQRAQVVLETNKDEVERFARALILVIRGEREFAELHARR